MGLSDNSTTIGHLHTLWRYPVKSVQGESLTACAVTSRGLADDRRWAVRGTDGKLGSGKNTRRFRAMAGLLEARATRSAEGVDLDLPDGTQVAGPGATADAALSRWLGEPVTLSAEDAVRHHDASPVHLVSTAALAWLGRVLGEPAAVDPRRFRPNLVVELMGPGDRPEDDLIGRRIRIGDVVLRVVERTERCVMVGAGQCDLPVDRRVLRTLAQETGACLGVYAEVERGGEVRCGDEVVELTAQ